MEASVGSSASAGVGYGHHEVGVFLNVMEDHLGSSDRLQSIEDIAEAKSFVVRRLKTDAYLVFNADDELVVRMLKHVPAAREAQLIPCGLKFSAFDIKKHLQAGGIAITAKNNKAILLQKNADTELFDLAALPWTFNATFVPSVYNLLHAAGAIYGYYESHLPKNFGKAMEACRLDSEGGRLTMLKAANGTRILVDYAHEKHSLKQVGELARTLAGKNGNVLGVVRLAYDRTPELIQDTGRFIAPYFDEFVVYDKIDGHFVKSQTVKGRRFQKEAGKVSQLLADAIGEKNPNVQRIVREDEAIETAAKQAKIGRAHV